MSGRKGSVAPFSFFGPRSEITSDRPLSAPLFVSPSVAKLQGITRVGCGLPSSFFPEKDVILSFLLFFFSLSRKERA